MDIWGWIFLISAVSVLCIWLWNREWKPEGFQNPPDLTGLPWVTSKLDTVARNGNACDVVERFADTELPDAWIEIVDSSCESGLPHTIGENQIRIPQSVWTTAERRAQILRHERIHLRQRRSPEKWADFYKREWMYTVQKDPPSALQTEVDSVRGNPDTWPDRWACWKHRYWFVPMYADLHEPKLPQASVKIWDSQQKVWLHSPPEEWRTFFCDNRGNCPYQSEHPAEISAEYATDLSSWTTPAAMSLRRFLEQNISG